LGKEKVPRAVTRDRAFLDDFRSLGFLGCGCSFGFDSSFGFGLFAAARGAGRIRLRGRPSE
jgi:hypothetical protein